MKYIKQYENINNIEIGDYVICLDSFDQNIELSEFIQSHIGQVIHVVYGMNYYVKYDDVPVNLDVYFGDINIDGVRLMDKTEITESSKNKKDLEYLIKANKYNL